MALPSAYEQAMLEMLNRARLDPAGEAARLGIDLNEGLSAGTLGTEARTPLAFNATLEVSAANHSLWMLAEDVFSHTGQGGSTATQRMTSAGYTLNGSWGTGENLTWWGTTGSFDRAAITERNHDSLFLSEGHRVNLLNGGFRDVGIGIETGVFTTGGTNFNAQMATQNFAVSGSHRYVTGVIFDDADGDRFYDVGEARAGSRLP